MTQDAADRPTPTAAIILIGNELLSGRTQDLNLAYIAERLASRGIRLSEARVIPDDRAVIIDVVNSLRACNTYVFTTGGIGPTHDDITADCIAEAFGVDLPIHPEAEARLLNYWATRNMTPNDARLRMARIPVGASLVDNPVSIAPGFRMDNVFAFAGVPRIMQAMFDNVLPTLQEGLVIGSVTVACTLGEGTLAGPLADLQARYPRVDLGSYPGFSDGNVRVALVARSTDAELLTLVGKELKSLVLSLGGELL